MNILFKPLSKTDFILIVKWLNQPHVQSWWPTQHKVTIEDVELKYEPRINGIEKVDCYIAYADQMPFGFVQIYDARLFAREGYNLNQIEEVSPINHLAAIDFFVGEPSYVGKGYGAVMIKRFVEQIVSPHYDACLADPDAKNVASIKSLEKAGFKKLKEILLSDGHSIMVMII